ncbi:MAG: biotin carboxyl carrier protein [Crocinitomicaceae bacterium]|jgi:biotin carboxyl carrier protein
MANPIWTIDGQAVNGGDNGVLTWEDYRFFTLLHHGKLFHGEVMEENIESHSITLKINHRVFVVKKNHELDELIASLGLDKPKVRQLKELSSPMPGRIVNIAVEVGQELSLGEELLSLEAMKMENVLKAEGVGIVKTILVAKDDIVEKGTVLIEFE